MIWIVTVTLKNEESGLEILVDIRWIIGVDNINGNRIGTLGVIRETIDREYSSITGRDIKHRKREKISTSLR